MLLSLQGQVKGDTRITCTACAGTLLLEFGVLSRLTGNATYEQKARHAVEVGEDGHGHAWQQMYVATAQPVVARGAITLWIDTNRVNWQEN